MADVTCPVDRLEKLCKERGLDVKYHNFVYKSGDTPTFGWTVTVGHASLEVKASSSWAATQEAASKMLDRLLNNKAVDEDKLIADMDALQAFDVTSSSSSSSETSSRKDDCAFISGKGVAEMLQRLKSPPETETINHSVVKSMVVAPQKKIDHMAHPVSRLNLLAPRHGFRVQFAKPKLVSPDTYEVVFRLNGRSYSGEGITSSAAKIVAANKILNEFGWNQSSDDNAHCQRASFCSSTPIPCSNDESSDNECESKRKSCSRPSDIGQRRRTRPLESSRQREERRQRDFANHRKFLEAQCFKLGLKYFFFTKDGFKHLTVGQETVSVGKKCKPEREVAAVTKKMFLKLGWGNEFYRFKEGRSSLNQEMVSPQTSPHKQDNPNHEGISSTYYCSSDQRSREERRHKELSNPINYLQFKSEMSGLKFHFNNMRENKGSYETCLTVGQDTITVEAKTRSETRRRAAIDMLHKRGWYQDFESFRGRPPASPTKIPVPPIEQEFSVSKHDRLNTSRSHSQDVFHSKRRPQEHHGGDQSSGLSIPMKLSLEAKKLLFDNEEKSDVCFIIGISGEQTRLIHGHSFIIGPASSVFKKLFETDWRDKPQVFFECQPNSFITILRYIYCQQVWYDKPLLLEVLSLAKKFGMNVLVKEIMATFPHVTEDILENHFWTVVQAAHDHNNSGLFAVVASFFQQNAAQLMQEEDFKNLHSHVKMKLLEDKKFPVYLKCAMIDKETKSMLNNPHKSDILFVVGKELQTKTAIYGHKSKISSFNTTFQKLFDGEWHSKSEIVIQSTPRAFLSVLRYIYLQKVWYEPTDLGEVMSLAKRFGMKDLWKKLMFNNRKSYFTDEVLKDHVWDILKFWHGHQDYSVFNLAVKYFHEHADDLVQTEDFKTLGVEIKATLFRKPVNGNVDQKAEFQFKNDENDMKLNKNMLNNLIIPVEEVAKPLISNPEPHTLFNNPDKSDITFMVGKRGGKIEKMFGHRDILEKASHGFRQHFIGNWNLKTQVEIEYSPSAFMAVLQYIYCRKLVLNSIDVVEVLSIAKAFDFQALKEEILVTIKGDKSNDLLQHAVYPLLKYSHEEHEESLFEITAQYFDEHAELLLEKDDFIDLNVELVDKLVRRSTMQVRETSLWLAIVLWADGKCRSLGEEPTPKNLRTKVEQFIREIRFPLMTGVEFRDGPATTKILKAVECFNIICAICLETDYETKYKACGFNAKPRTST